MKTPKELNLGLLMQSFRFKSDSQLEKFIVKETGQKWFNFTLVRLLLTLKKIIREGRMYDEKNPSVILAPTDLEAALGVRACHVTEIRDLVLEQLMALPQPSNSNKEMEEKYEEIKRSFDTLKENEEPATVVTNRITAERVRSVRAMISGTALFKLKPAFQRVIREVQDKGNKKEVFTYEEVAALLRTYILQRKDKLFDKSNIKIVHVVNDDLGRALDISAFHHSQLRNLLLSQLLPIQRVPEIELREQIKKNEE